MDLRSLPYFEQYFGYWAVEPQRFQSAYQHVRSLDLQLHMQSGAPEAAQEQAAYGEQFERTGGGIAIIRLEGTLMKHASSMTRSTSTAMARRAVRAAANDPDVRGILLHVDSPGGTVAGTKDLADDIAEAREKKTIFSYIEDIGASAAYWLASQANKVYANPTALVGSIGTFLVVYDYSQMAQMEGIKVHVVRAGEFKGAATPGTEVTSEQLAEFQRVVTELNDHFVRGVSDGRRITAKQARELADGRVHLSAPAKALGLVDGVQSFEETLRQLVSQTKKAKPMSQQQEGGATPVAATLKPVAATIADIKAGCPGATDSFIVAQMSANATLAQAQTAWMAEQKKMLEEANAKATKAEEEKAVAEKSAAEAAAKPAKHGVKPLATGTESGSSTADGGDAIAQFEAAVDAKVKAGKPKHVAHADVCRSQPQLREAYVAAYNELNADARQPARKDTA
jgi:signal peptide peptidase SppA